jgi:hypothetical protein
MIKSFLEEEAQGIVFKFCLAMVCVFVLIFSLFQLGYAFQLWVAQYKDSFQMSCALFSSTLLVSLVGMYFLFSKRKPEVKVKDREVADIAHPLMGMSLQQKVFVFIRGVIDGLVNGRSTY